MQRTLAAGSSLRKSALVPIIAGVLLAVMPLTIAIASPPGEPISATEQEVVDLVNAERAKVGVAPLTVNYSLMEAAWSHNEHMASTGCFSHTGCGNGDPGDRIKKTGYQAANWGENIAKGYPNPTAVMAGWMASSGHRANILRAGFKDIGVAHNSGQRLWTQVFGTPRPDYSTVTPPSGGGGPGPVEPPSCDLPEDLNGDQRVNRLDVDLIKTRFLQTAGHPAWDSAFDLQPDGIINLFDIFQVVTRVGASCP